jgi:hypothetical protein
MLIELPEVVSLLDELRKEFHATDPSTLYPAYLDRFNSVTEWKFSSGDYFHHEPYFEEQGGFPSAVLVKRTYASVDEARWLGKYCGGFMGDKRVIIVHPGQRAVKALHATLYDDNDSVLRVRTVAFKWIGKPEKMHALVTGIGRVISRSDNTKLEVGVGIGGAYTILLFQYSNEGRPLHARAVSKSHPGEAVWEYRYTPEGQLDEISAGGPIPLWQRKQA